VEALRARVERDMGPAAARLRAAEEEAEEGRAARAALGEARAGVAEAAEELARLQRQVNRLVSRTYSCPL
jgi:hypothetical protein